VHLLLDGTSATVLELVPDSGDPSPVLFNTMGIDDAANSTPSVVLKGKQLAIEHAAGEPGTHDEIGVLLPSTKAIADTKHDLKLRILGAGPAKLLGVFFDNVEPQRTEDTVSAITPE
jgi:hypothetical protein